MPLEQGMQAYHWTRSFERQHHCATHYFPSDALKKWLVWEITYHTESYINIHSHTLTSKPAVNSFKITYSIIIPSLFQQKQILKHGSASQDPSASSLLGGRSNLPRSRSGCVHLESSRKACAPRCWMCCWMVWGILKRSWFKLNAVEVI